MRRSLLIALTGPLFIACAPSSGDVVAAREVPAALQEDVAAAAGANNQFAFDLYAELGDGNVFFSPFSISTALAMLDAGAAGDTDAEIRAALHMELPGERAHEVNGALLDSLEIGRGFGAYTLATANRLFGQKGFEFLPSYLELLGESYDADLEEADFVADPEKVRLRVNDWVSKQTEGKIPALYAPGVLTPATVLVLVNAILFKGDWADPFDPAQTKSEAFHLAGGASATTTDMMSRMALLAETRIEGGRVGVLPFEGEDLAMIVLLPDSADGLPAIEAQLTPAALDEWVRGARPADEPILLSLPKFELETSLDLKETLRRLGIVSAFENADFSGIAGGGGLTLGDVRHKAVIAVDEKGAEAAAATGADINLSVPPTFVANRPFVFLIYDQVTGSVLFMGRVADPTAS